MEIRFYHLTTSSLEKALPSLLQKIYANGKKILVRGTDAEKMKLLDTHLWTFSSNIFLPHGMADVSHAELQPICLTTKDENPNQAHVSIMIDNAPMGPVAEKMEMALFIFDGTNEVEHTRARDLWKEYKEKNYSLTYWKQGENNGWEKSA